ncbi:unnamed protein product, partial [Rotaria magnacalcarata]
MDTGICIEDVIQTLIELRLAHTSSSTGETNCKQQESRDHRHHHRRRRKSNSDSDQCDDNNNT